jgi:hypothetical protein
MRSPNSTSAPASIWARPASRAFADEGDEMLAVRVHGLHAGGKGVDQHVDFGDRHGADRADDIGLGHLAGQHAGEIGAVMVPGAEDAEIVARSLAGGAEHEGGFRIVGSHLAGFLFHRVGFADDQLVALFGIFAHGARVVGARNAFREHIFDDPFFGGSLKCCVQAGIPGVLDRGRMDACNLERRSGAGEGCKARHTKCKSRSEQRAA